MRYVLLNHRYYPFLGGSERNVQEIAERFATEGHEVRVVTTNAFDLEYFWDRRRRPIDAPRREVHNGVEIERVPLRHLPASPLIFQGSRRMMGEFSRFPLPAAPFEFVSTNQPWLPSFDEAIGRAPVPDVVMGTNIGLEGLSITAARVARRVGAAFVLMPFIHLGRDDDPVARRYVSMPHQKKLLRAADAVVAMTPTELRYLVSIGVDARRIVIAGAGMTPADVAGGDGARFRRAQGIDGPIVAALGALAPDKGTRELVQAVASLNESGRAVTLAIAGPSLSTFERWYTRLSEAQRAGTRLLGVISPEEKRDLFDAADIVALPSRTESFGIVFVEAWANRKPVIAANAGAVPDLVRDGENGLLVPFGDVPSLSAAIRRLLDDDELSRRFGEAGYEIAMRDYTWEAVHERVKQAFEIAIGNRDAKAANR